MHSNSFLTTTVSSASVITFISFAKEKDQSLVHYSKHSTMLGYMLSTNPVIKQEPLSLESCSTVLQDVRQAMEDKTTTIENTSYKRGMNHLPYSQRTPALTTWEDGEQLQSAGIVHQYQQCCPQWKRESNRNNVNSSRVSNWVKVENQSNINERRRSSGVGRCDHRMISPEKIKREQIGFPTQYITCPVDTKFVSPVQGRKAMALHLDSFIQLEGSPSSPGLAVPDNSQGLLSDMYTDYSGSGPLFEDFTSTGYKGADTETDDLSFLLGCEELSSLTEVPSSFSLEEEWLTQPTQLPLTPDEPSEIPFTSVSPIPPTTSSEWFVQSTSLPLTPDKQEGDVIFSSVSPAPTPSPYTTNTSANITYPVLTPDSSLPSTPLSSQYNYPGEEELNNFLAIFEDGTPTDPIVIPSDPVSPSSSFGGTPSPLSSADSVESIRDLLLKPESPPLSPTKTCQRTSVQTSKAVSSRKRKSSSFGDEDDPSYQPSRPSSKRRLPQSVKKEKKREQNKNAALRYRQRKKEEKSDVEVQRQKLEDRNTELKKTVESLSNEINYLKKLWHEVVSAKKRKQQKQLS